MILWKKLFSKHSSAKPQTTSEDRLCTCLFVFDASKITEAISANYGAWAEEQLLKSFGCALQLYGGYALLHRTIQGCHGDMFRSEYRHLCLWVKSGTYERFRVEITALEPEFLNDLRLERMARDLFVVGLSPLDQLQWGQTDEDLRKRAYPDYYKGSVMLTGEPSMEYLLENTNLSRDYLENLRSTDRLGYNSVMGISCCPFISDVAGTLRLISLGIEVAKRGRCKGWLPKHETLRDIGLIPD